MTIATLLTIVMVACATPQPQSRARSSLTAIIRVGVQLADTRARPNAPAIADMVSFAKLRAVTKEEPYDISGISRALGRRLLDLSRQNAIRCERAGVGCAVVEDGIFAQVDSAYSQGELVTAFVTYAFTERRRSGAVATCTLPTRILLMRKIKAWEATEVAPLRRC